MATALCYPPTASYTLLLPLLPPTASYCLLLPFATLLHPPTACCYLPTASYCFLHPPTAPTPSYCLPLPPTAFCYPPGCADAMLAVCNATNTSPCLSKCTRPTNLKARLKTLLPCDPRDSQMLCLSGIARQFVSNATNTPPCLSKRTRPTNLGARPKALLPCNPHGFTKKSSYRGSVQRTRLSPTPHLALQLIQGPPIECAQRAPLLRPCTTHTTLTNTSPCPATHTGSTNLGALLETLLPCDPQAAQELLDEVAAGRSWQRVLPVPLPQGHCNVRK